MNTPTGRRQTDRPEYQSLPSSAATKRWKEELIGRGIELLSAMRPDLSEAEARILANQMYGDPKPGKGKSIVPYLQRLTAKAMELRQEYLAGQRLTIRQACREALRSFGRR